MTAHRRAAIGDVAFGVICAVCIAVLMVDAANLGERARLFPMAVLWCLLISALIVLSVGAAKLFRDDGEGDAAPAGGAIATLAPPLLVIAGGIMLVWFGFYVTAPVFIFAMHALHTRLSTGAAPTGRMLLSGVALAVIATVIMYVIFDILIGLPAPGGAVF